MLTTPKLKPTKTILIKGKTIRYNPLLVGIVAVVAIVLIGAVVWFTQSKPAQTQATYEVRRSDVDVKVTATGVIRPYKQVKVSPKQMGLIKHLYVKQGDFIKKGEPIAKMDDVNLLAQYDSAKAAYLVARDQFEKSRRGNRPQEIASAAFQVSRAEKAVSQAKQNVSRLELQVHSMEAQAERDKQNAARQTMLASNGAISEQDRLNAATQAEVTATQLKMAQAELKQAHVAVLQAEAELAATKQQHNLMESGNRSEDISAANHSMMQAQAQMRHLETQLNDLIVRAPFDGVVTQKYADEGAIVTPTTSAATNSATSSSIIALAGELEMVAQVSEADIAKVRLGQDVEITATAFPGKRYRGVVTQIAPEAIVTSNVTTFEVHAALDRSTELLSGMNVSARFIAGKEKNALLVPTVAIVSRRGETGVFVVEPNSSEPKWRPVKVGPSIENRTIIKEGLKAGEKVAMGLDREQLDKFGYGGRGGGMRGMSPMGGFGGMGGMGGMGRGFGGGGRGGGGGR